MDPQLIPYGWGLFTEKDEVSPLCISSTSTKSEVEKNISRWSWWSRRRRRRRPRRRRYKLEKLTHISSIQYLSWQRALTVHYWSILRWDESEWSPNKYVPKKVTNRLLLEPRSTSSRHHLLQYRWWERFEKIEFFSLFLARKRLSSGQKWFLRPYSPLIRGMFVFRCGLRFSFRALKVPEPR